MLITGRVKIQDLNFERSGRNTERWLKSFILTKKVNNVYFVSVKNSMFPNCIDYKCSNIEKMYFRFVVEGKMGFLFKEPKCQLLLESDDKNLLMSFARQIRCILDGDNVVVSNRERMPKSLAALRTSVTNIFDPSSKYFEATTNFIDTRILNMNNLQKLLLENVTVNTLPERIGDLPIVYLSLNNLKVSETATTYDRDSLWDWMSKDKIIHTLRVLKMDNIGLNKLPFELSFLKGVQILSVARNNLEYLPHYIDQLNIKQLDVSNNKLMYLPTSLQFHDFHSLNISGNKFSIPLSEVRQYDHIGLYMRSHGYEETDPYKPIVNELTYLTLTRLVECNIRFKRQHIPRTLWHLFDLLARCVHCKKYSLPCNVKIMYDFAILATQCLIYSDNNARLLYQGILCKKHLPKKPIVCS